MLCPVEPVLRPVVLTSWKEIAQQLGKAVRTAQRWEQRFGLPIRRPLGCGLKSAVLASPKELEDWLKSSSGRCTRHERLSKAGALLDLLRSVDDAIRRSNSLRQTRRRLMNQIREQVTSLRSYCADLEGRCARVADLDQTSKNGCLDLDRI